MEPVDHILIVDDDAEIRNLLAQYLEKAGMRVSVASGSRQMRSILAAKSVDLLVLDLMLTGESGLDLCRDLRAGPHQAIPILILTARNDEPDRIVGLEMGADDYLTKPFVSRELLARIRAILRRARMLPPNMRVRESTRQFTFGTWVLDTTVRNLADQTGALVGLSGAEYRLLRVFLEHPQTILSREQLLSMTAGREADVFDRSIDTLVSRLRQRLGDDSREQQYIKTVRSEGYVFCVPVSATDFIST
ncbi:MAG TPA: response regulator transcription factor [Noviherbaspirillum sp.]|nr:response regulator transcription factor [Noviherbaspirillum sp.]